MKCSLYIRIFCIFCVNLFVLEVIHSSNSEFNSSQSIKIPFRYIQSFIIVDVQLEKILPVRLIFDTGSEHTILFEKKWTDIILDSYIREIKVIGSDLKMEIPALLTHPINLMFPGHKEFNSPLIVLKENTTNISQIIGEPIQGILSASLFSHYLIEIDYKNNYLVLHANNYKVDPDYTEIDIEVYKNKPYLSTQIKNRTDTDQTIKLLLDTGASLSLLMYSDSSTNLQIPDKVIPGYLGSGLGGMLNGFVGKMESIWIDTFEIHSVITHFLQLETSIAHTEAKHKQGIIGNQILDKFKIFLDYTNAKLYLKPGKKFDKRLSYDKSGMLIVSGGPDLQKYYIAYVIPGTPADAAGIRENDRITKINGYPASFISLRKINNMLHGETGKRIKLTIRRDGKKYKFVFNLKDLI